MGRELASAFRRELSLEYQSCHDKNHSYLLYKSTMPSRVPLQPFSRNACLKC
jgi:hypothetical protein